MDNAIRSCILFQVVLLIDALRRSGCLQGFSGHNGRGNCVGICFVLSAVLLLFCSNWFLPYAVCIMMMVVNYAFLASKQNCPDRKLFWASVALLVPVLMVGTYPRMSSCQELGANESAGMQRVNALESHELYAKTACNCQFGDGAYEKAHVEKTETDSAYRFAISIPGGTNCVIRVMKDDGKVYMDANAKGNGK